MLNRRPMAFVVVLLTVGSLSVAGQRAHVWGGFENQAQDLLQPGTASGGQVVTVGIDRATLAAVGEPWPWPRARQAELIAAVARAGARVIAYDVVLADALPGDEAMTAALDLTPTVLASAMTLRLEPNAAPQIVDSVTPLPELSEHAAGTGHANVAISEARGVVRAIPLFVRSPRGAAVPSLALAAVAAFDGVAATVVERADGVQVGARFVPLPDDGLFRVNWADGLERAEIVPAIEILRGVETARLADKIVIVGVTEPTFGDLHLVPTDRSGSTPGVVVHANAVNTVLTASFLTPVGALREVVLLLAVVAIVAAAFIWLRLSIAALAGFAAIALVIGFGTWRFHTAGELWPLVWPAVGATMAALAGWAWRYVVEIRHRRRAWKLFATYVPATVVDQLAEQGRLEEAIDGARLDIAVVFCDLRGFTPIAATLEPAEVRRLLDRYYDYAVALIHASGGTVMQFVGDEVFAVFGAPIPSSTFVVDALRCAQALQANVGRLDAALAEAGLPPIRFGIGVHRGPVVAAHVGTTDRRQYAVIGDTVNVGSRLCGQAGPSEIVTSTTTVDTLDVDLLVELGLELEEPVELKGVNEPVGVLRRRSTPRSSPV